MFDLLLKYLDVVRNSDNKRASWARIKSKNVCGAAELNLNLGACPIACGLPTHGRLGASISLEVGLAGGSYPC